MISNNATRCRVYGLRTRFSSVQIISCKVDWPALNRVWVNLEQLSRNLDIKIFAPKHQFYIQQYFSYMFLRPKISYYAKKFLCCAFLLCKKVLKVPKSSNCARSYRAKKFLLCAFLRSCAHRRIYWTEKY